MQKLFIIKIGGNVLDDESAYQKFLDDFASLPDLKILVHGGGKIATQLGEQLGINPDYFQGRRITDAPTRDLVTMVYGGLINKRLVSQLQQRACNAFGMTGADGALLKASKRQVGDVDYGYVGDILPADVNTALLVTLLKEKTIPVVAPLTLGDGEILNTNADTVAAVLAIALSKNFDVRLIYCFDKKGVLKDVRDKASIISSMNEDDFIRLKREGALADGILPKLENAFAAINAGVQEILIGEAADLLQNIQEKATGTLIYRFVS